MLATWGVRLRRIYYGWYIVALGYVAMLMSAGLQAYTFTVFFKPVITEMGWSRTALSATQSLSVIVSGSLGPFVGGYIDRYGSRGFMVFGALIQGGSLMLLSRVQNLWQFYVVRSLLFSLGQFCMGNLSVSVAIANWFTRMRGRAMAFSAMGVSSGGLLLTPLATWLIEAYGWRTAWLVMGFLVWIAVILPAALIMRHRPEVMGLRPDGEVADIAGASSPVRTPIASEGVTWNRRQALRTRALWLVLIAQLMGGMGTGALVLHVHPFLTDLGFSPALASAAVSTWAFFAFISKFGWGFLVERVPVRYCAAAEYVLGGLGITVLLAMTQPWMAFLGLAFFGTGVGASITVHEVLWANYYGRLSVGKIRGMIFPFQFLSSAGGPLFAGVMHDLTGSYRGAFTVLVFLPLMAVGIMLMAKPPIHPSLRARPESSSRRASHY